MYTDHRHFHLYRCHFRHRSGAPGSLRAFHLHHCRTSDCIHSEYHPRMVCHPRNRTADDNIHTTIREGTLLRIPLRNVPAGKHCGICPARQSIQKTGRCSQKHGAWLSHQRADDDDGLSWNYDRFHKPGYGRYQRTDTAYGAKRYWKRIYDTVNFHSDYPRCRIHRRKYGCRHGETCIRRT